MWTACRCIIVRNVSCGYMQLIPPPPPPTSAHSARPHLAFKPSHNTPASLSLPSCLPSSLPSCLPFPPLLPPFLPFPLIGLVSSAPVTRKFPTPPEPAKFKPQRGPLPASSLSDSIRRAPSDPEVNKAREHLDSVLSAASKKSFSPRFAKKVSCLAAAGDGDSDSDDDRVLLQRQQQQQKGKKGKEKKGSFKAKFPLAADSRVQKSATSRMVPVKDDSGSLSLQHSSPVRHQLPRSPRE